MSIICQLCHEAKAAVHITDIVPEKRERHLCEDCAEKEGVIIKQGPSTGEILQQFLKQKSVASGSADISCPKCGCTFREFQVKGQLGCPHDYEVFKSVLGPLIERAHGGATQHVGKVPATADATIQKQAGLLQLRRELEGAIQQEDYERAANLRDRIKELESEAE
ncbi:MAG: UvrB/UvrC motif-containing protein [Phycisphaerae bacterium]|jgi:protein arginine kinase activator